MRFIRVLLPSAAALLICFQGSAQEVISAHSGVVNFSEGSVFLDDQPLDHKFGTFPDIKDGSTLRTEKGRAEILLTPGMFLRMDENSAIRMRSNSLADTRVEFLHGSAIVDAADAAPDNHVSVFYKGTQVRFPEQGIYRLDYETGTLQAYSGEAEVTHDGKTSKIDESHLFFFTLDLDTKKLGGGTEDEFYDWARARSDAISEENQLAAQAGNDNDLDSGDPNGLGVDPNIGIPGGGIQSPGIPGASIPSMGVPSYPTLGYNYPLYNGLYSPFSPYGLGWPGYPFATFPVFVLVPYRYWPNHKAPPNGGTSVARTNPTLPRSTPTGPRTSPMWPRTSPSGLRTDPMLPRTGLIGRGSSLTGPRTTLTGPRTGTGLGYLPGSTGIPRVPMPTVRPSYVGPRSMPSIGARPGYSHMGVTAPHAPAPPAVHAIGHR
jgi:FecR protein